MNANIADVDKGDRLSTALPWKEHVWCFTSTCHARWYVAVFVVGGVLWKLVASS